MVYIKMQRLQTSSRPPHTEILAGIVTKTSESEYFHTEHYSSAPKSHSPTLTIVSGPTCFSHFITYQDP